MWAKVKVLSMREGNRGSSPSELDNRSDVRNSPTEKWEN